MGNKDITDFNEAQLRKRAASKEELNIAELQSEVLVCKIKFLGADFG